MVVIFARQTSFDAGSIFRVNRSHVTLSFLFVHGTCTVFCSRCSRPSRTIQAVSVNPPRSSSPTATLTGHWVRPGAVQNLFSTRPARETSTSARPRLYPVPMIA